MRGDVVAASGGGIATLPAFIAQPYDASGELVRVLPSVRVNSGGLVLIYSSTRPLARKSGGWALSATRGVG